MKITPEEVRETALLARLELDDAEVARMTRELDAILGYMETLAALRVDGVEPTTHAVPLDCPLRVDPLGEHLPLAPARCCSASSAWTSSPWARRTRTRRSGRSRIRGTPRACRAARRAARRRRWREAWRRRRSAPTPADRSGSRRRFAGWSGSSRPT